MIKHLLLLSIISLSVVSCKKDQFQAVPGGDYFVTANLNGIPATFNTVVTASRADERRSPNLLFVTGRSGELNTREIVPSLTLILNDDAPLTHKTYVSGVDPVNVGFSFAQLTPYNAEPGFEITVNQLTSKEIRGSFKGKLKSTAGEIIDVTEGMFFSRIH